MPRWSKAQETTRRSIEALASSELTLNEISHRTMAALRGAVGWDGYRLFGVDPQTLLINALIAASDNDDWARDEYLSEVYLAADPLNYIELPFLMRAKLPAVAFQDRQDQCWGYSPAILSALDATHHEHTVEGHLRQIYGKLEVRSRSQLVARWFRECQLSTIQQDAGPSCRQAPCTSAKERSISRSCSIIA